MSDVFHKEYRELTEEEKQIMQDIKTKAEELNNLYESITNTVGNSSDNRERNRPVSIAKTELESSVMWAVKGLTA